MINNLKVKNKMGDGTTCKRTKVKATLPKAKSIRALTPSA